MRAQSNEADTESNEVIHNDTQSNETSEQSTEEPKHNKIKHLMMLRHKK